MKRPFRSARTILVASIALLLLATTLAIYALTATSSHNKRLTTRYGIAQTLQPQYAEARSYQGWSEKAASNPAKAEELLALPNGLRGVLGNVEYSQARDGWQRVRAVVTFSAVSLAQLPALDAATQLPHPWRLTSIDLQVKEADVAEVTATFETVSR